jgi:hypothetical protein
VLPHKTDPAVHQAAVAERHRKNKEAKKMRGIINQAKDKHRGNVRK